MKKFKGIFKDYENNEAKEIGIKLADLFEKSLEDIEISDNKNKH